MCLYAHLDAVIYKKYARRKDLTEVALMVFVKNDFGGGAIKKQGGFKNGSNFNETASGGRRSLRTPDSQMEPENG